MQKVQVSEGSSLKDSGAGIPKMTLLASDSTGPINKEGLDFCEDPC